MLKILGAYKLKITGQTLMLYKWWQARKLVKLSIVTHRSLNKFKVAKCETWITKSVGQRFYH